jgi:monoamine oxidase
LTGVPGVTRREFVGAGAAGAAAFALPASARAARSRTRVADVVVIGAGLSGLTAARALKAAGRRVIVLEARTRVGGRMLNESIGGGDILEVGGQFVGPTQDRLLALARTLGVDTFPTFNQGLNVQLVGGERSLYPAAAGVPSDPETQKLLLDFISRLDPIAEEVGATAPWKAKRAAELDAITLDAFARPFVGARVRPVFEAVVSSIWGADSTQLSLLYAAAYVAAAGDADHPGSLFRLASTAGGAQERRFVGGSQLIPLRMAERLGSRVVLGTPVSRVSNTARGVRVHARGLTVEARRAIVAVPPPLALPITRRLSPRRARLLAGMRMGHLVKSAAVYPTPFWRAAGLSGQGVNDRGTASVPFDNSPPDGSVGVLFAFTGGRAADRLATLSPLSAAPRSSPASRSTSASRPSRRRATSRRTGATSATRAAARRPSWDPACSRATEVRFAGRSVRCTSRAPRPPTTGRATWTVRSAPASVPRER